MDFRSDLCATKGLLQSSRIVLPPLKIQEGFLIQPQPFSLRLFASK